MVLNFNGYTYHIERLENEVDRSYQMRRWFIVSMNPKNIEDLEKSMKLAKLFVNYKLLGCQYPKKVSEMFLKHVPLCF